MPTLLAGPRDPLSHAKFVNTVQSATRFEPGPEGEVSLGAALPVLLLAGKDGGDALLFGVQSAVYGRFSLQTLERDLISTDWVILTPLVWHRGAHWIRIGYHHISSHLGDDYRNRFGVTAIDYGRDAADALTYIRLHPSIGIFGGINAAYNVHPETAGRWTLRLGGEIAPRSDRHSLTPYGAWDVQLEEDRNWEPRVTVQLGTRLPALDGRRVVRVGVEFLTGPSPQGQFHDRKAAELSLGIWVDL